MPRTKTLLSSSTRSPQRRARSRTHPTPPFSSQFLECLLAHSGSCIAVVQGPELRYTLVSPAYQALAPGVPMVGRTYRQVFPEAAQNGAEARLQQVLATGEPWQADARQAPLPGESTAPGLSKVVRLPLEAGQAPSALIVLLDITDRVGADRAVHDREEQSRLTLESIGDGFIACDEAWNLVYINGKAEQLLGIPRERLIGKNHWDLFPLSRGTRLESEYRRAAAGEPRDFENYYEPWDRWFHNRCFPRPGGGMSVFFQDITVRKRAEQALQTSEQQLRVALGAGQMGTWVWDTRTGLVWSDPLHRQIWDLPDEAAVMPVELILNQVHPEDREKLVTPKHLEQLTGPFDHEIRMCRCNGEVRWVHSSATPVYDEDGVLRKVIGVNFDTTERKRAEEALRQSEQRFRQVVESLPQLVWTARPDGFCDYLSPQWVTYTGVPEAPQLGWGWLEQVHPEDRPGTCQQWQETTQQGLTFDSEFRIRRADGVYRWFRALGVPLRHEAGGITKWFGTNTDVSEKREAELVLARSKEELECLVAERTAKLQELVGELEHFSYTITHDMRAPLRSMRGFAELVLELCEATAPPEQQSLLRRVITSAERMDLLITDALSYSRAVRQELPLGPVDLGTLLRGMLDTYPEFQAANAHIQLQGSLPLVLGNQAGLTQVFSNLLGNAIKFAKPGQPSGIRIWAEEVPPREGTTPSAGHAAVLGTPTPSLVKVWVEDQGIGISKAMLPRVFNMFARGNSGHSGTGIGLALVRKVVDRMGGRVGVWSEEGAGSRFWLELLPGDPRQPAPVLRPSAPPGPGSIL